MKSIEEIIAQADTNQTSSVSEVLNSARNLVREGRFAEVAEVLAIWCKHQPESKEFIQASIVDVVLHDYLFTRNLLSFSAFLEWSETHLKWPDSIAEHALSPRQLPKAVGLVVESMERFITSNAAQA